MAGEQADAASAVAAGPAVPAEAPLADPRALDRLFAGEPARHILRYVLGEYAPGRTAVVSSFGADSAVLLHMVAAIDPATPVIFLDTLKHFPETLAHRDRVTRELGLGDVRSVQPDGHRTAAMDARGHLHRLDADACCRIRKAEPLERALAPFAVWITGRKRHQSATRRNLPLFERDGRHVKVNPLAEWESGDIEDYAAIHDLPAHKLVARGYPSIGCAPCTSRVETGEDARAGRWRDSDKSECGIHLTLNGHFVRNLSHAGAGC